MIERLGPVCIRGTRDARWLPERGRTPGALPVEGLRRAGKDHAWAVIAFEEPAERDRFVAPSPA